MADRPTEEEMDSVLLGGPSVARVNTPVAPSRRTMGIFDPEEEEMERVIQGERPAPNVPGGIGLFQEEEDEINRALLGPDAPPARAVLGRGEIPRTQEGVDALKMEYDRDMNDAIETHQKRALEHDIRQSTNLKVSGRDDRPVTANDAFRQPDHDLIDPEGDEDFDAGDTIRGVVNFLFSDEMALLGFKWEDEAAEWGEAGFTQHNQENPYSGAGAGGFSWDPSHITEQLRDHPYATAFTLASYLVPMGFAWRKGSRIAERALGLAKVAGGSRAAVKGSGFLGTKLGWKADDHVQLVTHLADPKVNEGRQLFSKNSIEALKEARTLEDVTAVVSPRDLNKMLINDWHQDQWLHLQGKAAAGEFDFLDQTGRLIQDELGKRIPIPAKKLKEAATWHLWKTFSNRYTKGLQEGTKEMITGMDEFFVKSNIGNYLAEASALGFTAKGSKAVYKYLLEGPGRQVAELTKKGSGVTERQAAYAEGLAGKWTELFDDQVMEGFVSGETAKMFRDAAGVGSGFHLQALRKGTPGATDLSGRYREIAPHSVSNIGDVKRMQTASKWDMTRALTGPTTKHRGKWTTKQSILDDIDLLDTDTTRLVAGGLIKDSLLFQIHRNFRDVIVDAAEKGSNWTPHVISREMFGKLQGTESISRWMDLDDMDNVIPGLAATMRRMIDAKVTKEGLDPNKYKELPLVNRELVEQFFGADGSARQDARAFGQFFELLTAVHKTSRTAMNIPTHMSNVLGNMMFLQMAGMNAFSRTAMSDGRLLTSMYGKIATRVKNSPDAADTVEKLMSYDNLKAFLGKDQFMTDKYGKKIDLAEMFSDPVMKELVEASAFEQVEGMKHVKTVLSTIEQLETDKWSDHAVATVARAISGFGDAPVIKPTLHAMSSAYLAEDMIPKMMYAMNLARKGFGRDAIIREVGRRLPQYATVGKLPKASRRVMLPWITFTSEATRIMKNNMMDRPVNMMVWMQAPEIAQSIATVTGVGTSFDELGDAIDSAPSWAERYQTTYLKGDKADAFLSTLGGAAMGGLMGAAKGGPKGAALGTVGGAAAGYGLSKAAPSPDYKTSLAGFNRAWTMDFLPHSSLMASSMHPDAWEKVLPLEDPNDPNAIRWGGRPRTGNEFFRTAMDLLPVQPLATFTPLFDVITGKGSFGREVESNGGIQFAGKMALGLLGHLAPPAIQKYGMKIEGPSGNPFNMDEVFENNGSRMTLPKALTATVGGLAMAGLTFMGAKAGGAGGAKLAASTALSLGLGALGGSEMNVRRLQTDLGIAKDPTTAEYATPTLDFFQNTFFGVSKSFESGPKRALYNIGMRDRKFGDQRKTTIKDLKDAVLQGSRGRTAALFGEVHKSYIYQYGNTVQAREAYVRWRKAFIRNLGESKATSGMSMERLAQQAISSEAASDEIRKVRSAQAIEAQSTMQLRETKNVHGLRIMPPQ